jgi:hypothetical protein
MNELSFGRILVERLETHGNKRNKSFLVALLDGKIFSTHIDCSRLLSLLYSTFEVFIEITSRSLICSGYCNMISQLQCTYSLLFTQIFSNVLPFSLWIFKELFFRRCILPFPYFNPMSQTSRF